LSGRLRKRNDLQKSRAKPSRECESNSEGKSH